MTPTSAPACLIVNADDYGYFRCVSKGILHSAAHGIVTATGVFANAPDFPEHAAWLRDCDALDTGVHLNLTGGSPLTTDMGRKLLRSSARFPGKFSMAGAILSGTIKVADVHVEWRAQIERCLENGVRVTFLNSHEHMHMLPPLFPVAGALAREYGISHIRFPTSEFARGISRGSRLRSLIMKMLETINRRRAHTPTALFLGMGPSGKLDLAYLEQTIARLGAGRIYELMCHPGHFDPEEVRDPRLTVYHDWEGELRALTSPVARELLQRHRVRLIGYRHVEVRDDRLVLRHETA
jgi:chitin disaccharide deacetylase